MIKQQTVWVFLKTDSSSVGRVNPVTETWPVPSYRRYSTLQALRNRRVRGEGREEVEMQHFITYYATSMIVSVAQSQAYTDETLDNQYRCVQHKKAYRGK